MIIFFPSPPLVFSERRDSERDIHSCCVGCGGKILSGRLSEVPMWACAHLQAHIPVVFSRCHLAFFHISEESLQKPSRFYFSLCNAQTSLLSSLRGSYKQICHLSPLQDILHLLMSPFGNVKSRFSSNLFTNVVLKHERVGDCALRQVKKA